MSTEQAKFLEGSLFRHITTMSLTASVGLMAVFIVDFVDMIFISMLGKEELAAAVGYAGAILFFTTSFGIGMSIAAGALTARAIGSGDAAEGERRTATSLFFGVVLGSVFAAIVWFNLPYLSALMGASGDTLDLSVEYLRIIVPSLPFLLAGMVGSAVLRAHGDARRAMMATIWGGVANAVLDPILIFGLGLELKGGGDCLGGGAHDDCGCRALSVDPDAWRRAPANGARTQTGPVPDHGDCVSGHPDPAGHADWSGLCHPFDGAFR